MIGKQQANLGEEQLRLTKEQVRTKTKDVRITAHLSQAKFERDGRKLRMVHFHLVNVGEVTINRGDFLVGPYLDFERPVVDECSFSAVRPGSLRAACNVKHKQYVEIKIPVDFRTDDFISFNVTFIDEPGPITCTYRIKDGEARTSDVQIELFGDLIAVPAAPL